MWIVLALSIFLPGFVLAVALLRSEIANLLSIPLSLSLYVLVLVCGVLLGKTHWVFPTYLTLGIIISLVAVSSPWWRLRLKERVAGLVEFTPVLLLLVCYQYFSGPFIDHGIDLFWHLHTVQTAANYLTDFSGQLQVSLRLGTQNNAFHYIAAYFSTQTGTPPHRLIEIISIAYPALWSFSIFYFCKYIFRLVGVDKAQLVLSCSLAVFFYWTTFGINNFSFPRYYIGGPVILNYCIFLALVVLLIEQITTRISPKLTVLMALLVMVSTYLHPQEAILFLTFCFALSIAYFLPRIGLGPYSLDIIPSRRNSQIMFAMFAALLLGFALIIFNLPPYSFDPVRLLNLGVVSQKLSSLNILNPTRQFYTVLGIWGFYVYLIALIYYKAITKSAIMLAALILPLVTVFNPLYTEAYLRLTYPQVLWRVLFAMYLPIVASYLILTSLAGWKLMSGSTRFWRLLLLVPLFGLLLPFKNDFINNSMVRSPSLVRSPVENSYKNWIDLIEFLQGLETRQRILTDPATGYAIRALTQHRYHGFKFFKSNYNEFNFENYQNDPLKQYVGWILVVNLRGGQINSRLNAPHHIYPNIMHTAEHYGPPLFQELELNPQKYQLLWKSDKIFVYLIQ